NFRLGEVKLNTEFVKGWDYEDCSDFEIGDALTDMGCEYGIELAFKAEGGKLMLAQLVLVMEDIDAAEDAVEDVTDSDFELHKEGYISNFSYGKWVIDNAGRYVVITVCTATKEVSEDKA